MSDHPTFEQDPLEYCKSLYTDFDKHNEKQSQRVEENRKFYEGIDEDLETRKRNAKVVRSAQFVHELRPAIETFIAAQVDAILEQDNPVKASLTSDSDDPQDAVIRIEEKLNEELREAGVLIQKFSEALLGGATMPLVACKVGWEEEEGWIYEKTPFVEMAWNQLLYMVRLRRNPPERTRKRWGVVRRGPYAELLDYDEFLYDARVDNLNNSEVLIHRKYMTMDEIEADADQYDYDPAALERLKHDYETAGDNSAGDGTIADEVAKETEDRAVSYKDGKILVAEFWVPTVDNQGRDEVRVYTLAANKFKLCREKHGRVSPWGKIKFPFVIFRFNPQFNRIEGTPLVEVGKPIQKIYNDNINAFLDYLTYGVFPVLKRAPGTVISGKPVFGPGAIWDVSEPQGLEVLHLPAGDIPAVLQFSEIMHNKMGQMMTAPEIAQGLEGDREEKATKTRVRAAALKTRNRLPAKLAGDFIIQIAQMFVYMHQAMGDEEWFMDIRVDVPSLTGAKSPQEEREDAIFLFEMAMKHPAYQTPIGLLKLNRLWIDILHKFRKRDIDQISVTDKELGFINPLGEQIEGEAKLQEQSVALEDGNPQGNVLPMGGETQGE